MLLRAPAESSSWVVDFPVCLILWLVKQKCLIAKTPFEEVPRGIKTWEIFKICINKLLLPNEFLLWLWKCVVVMGKTQRLCLIKSNPCIFVFPSHIHPQGCLLSRGHAVCLEPGCSSPFCFSKRPCNSLIIRYCCVKNTIFWELEGRFLAPVRELWLTFWEGTETSLFLREIWVVSHCAGPFL